MDKYITIAYGLSCHDNHEHFFTNAPENIFCTKCERCIDPSYLPDDFKIRNKSDFSATYDNRFISSVRFKEYIEELNFNVEFIPLNKDNSLFLMKPLNILEYSALERDRFCTECHQYNDQVLPVPEFFYKNGKTLEDGIFSTSIGFGSGREISPSIIIGIKTCQIIKDATKKFKFRGLSISPKKSQNSICK